MSLPPSRPLPRPDAQTRPFWEGCAQGVLRFQTCAACGSVQRVPRALCEHCQSDALNWRASAGIGKVLSLTTVHRAPLPAFKAMAPYVIAIVDMDEGFRLMVNATAEAAKSIAIDAKVQIGFIDVEASVLPIVQHVIRTGEA
ncbi:Zn-ribbon domain-containing OB-fold protein [Bordetella sp. 15P40C-2]|uniref:Zn-ribbon domain-containing OB-fold protein n=1 Tax=Bordetella sp. 15P40C-2 TaxID=2572246 RepID=UPI001328E5B2|nr:Zn-ribbon domain-containing OB-fold protein [Bordetella sp. 15P40C-2]MVW70990.1 hypothetical protein [Bordetella sp. 15P40C-2]